MARKPSLQDLVQNRQQRGFVGRAVELSQFQVNLDLPIDDGNRRFLFNIYGDAGVGKTYLAGRLRQLAADRGALTAHLDDTAGDPTVAMRTIARQFAEDGARLGRFEKRADKYERQRQELASDPDAPEGMAAFLTQTAVTIGLKAASSVPLAGSLLAALEPASASQQVNQLRTYLTKRLRNDAELLLSPAEALTPLFVADLNRVAASRPVALFIDAYERTGLVLDDWLRHLYGGRYGDLPATLVTTISGQKPLNPSVWSDYLSVIADVPLEPFSDAEARKLLTAEGVRDEDMIQRIMFLSGRLPLWLATLAAARPGTVSEIGSPAGHVVDEFLRSLADPVRKRVAVAAALPRVLNQDVLAEVAGAKEAQELFGWLRGLPFINPRRGSWAYHEAPRAALLRLQKAEAPREWTSRQNALAQAHERWASEAAVGDGKNWSNPQWIDCTLEGEYHLLCASPANLPVALLSAVKAAEHSPIRSRQWAEMIIDAGRDADHSRIRELGERLGDGIRDGDLTGYLTVLINDAGLSDSALGTAFQQRGRGHLLARRHGDALADFNRAIEVSPENGMAIGERGLTYQLLKRYEEALADYDRAIELNPENATFIASRGGVYQLMERYEEAVANFSRAIDLNPGNSWAVSSRGAAYLSTGRYQEALADFNRAIELNPEDSWAIISHGEACRKMGLYHEALADCSRLIQLDPKDVLAIGDRGLTYELMGRYEEALTDFSQAIELDPRDFRSIILLGASYLLMGRHEEALADFNRLIQLHPGNNWAVGVRAGIYLVMERYEEALTDFNQLIEHADEGTMADFTHVLQLVDTDNSSIVRFVELHSDNSSVIRLFGEAGQFMEFVEDARANFNQAIEFNPGNSWAIGARGLTYLVTDRHEEALADFNRLIQLHPGNNWALDIRGWAYLFMERYEEALADVNQAVQRLGHGTARRAPSAYDRARARTRACRLNQGAGRTPMTRVRSSLVSSSLPGTVV